MELEEGELIEGMFVGTNTNKNLQSNRLHNHNVFVILFSGVLNILIGIEANDVSTLLEQFLEYEEKQGVVKGTSQCFTPHMKGLDTWTCY